MERTKTSFSELNRTSYRKEDQFVFDNLEFTEETVTINSTEDAYLFNNCKFNTLTIHQARKVRFFKKSECAIINIFNSDNFQCFDSTITGTLKILSQGGERGIQLDNATINNLFLHPNFGTCTGFEANLCTFNYLTLNRISAHKSETTKFTLCIVQRRMNIEYSILDNIGINGLDLSNTELRILDSSIVKANYYSVTWPRTFQIVEEIEDKKFLQLVDINDIIKLQAIYRQLKTISINISNKVEARKFLKNEMRLYHRQIFLQLKATPIPKKFLLFISLCADVFMLWVNKKFTDYGESILRPLVTLLFIGFLFFYWYMHRLGIQLAINTPIDWEVTRQAFGYYLNFLNPVHAYEIPDINGVKKIPLYGVTDFLFRLISGFLIYHIIRATRKFNFSV